jgi:hypothetical protein
MTLMPLATQVYADFFNVKMEIEPFILNFYKFIFLKSA